VCIHVEGQGSEGSLKGVAAMEKLKNLPRGVAGGGAGGGVVAGCKGNQRTESRARAGRVIRPRARNSVDRMRSSESKHGMGTQGWQDTDAFQESGYQSEGYMTKLFSSSALSSLDRRHHAHFSVGSRKSGV